MRLHLSVRAGFLFLTFLAVGGCCCQTANQPGPGPETGTPGETDPTFVSADEKLPLTVAMFGNGPGRNMANTTEKGIPDDFSIKKGEQKHIKWTAVLGTRAYGGPVVAGDRIFIGTNNDRPRDKAIKGDKGVLMCFRASDGAFQWQHVYNRLPDEGNNAPREGLISAPAVEGNRLWYASNRGEIVCSTVEGKVQWKYDIIKELDVYIGQHMYTSPLVVGDLVYALTCNGADHLTGKLPRPKAPALIALDKNTGKLAWSDNHPGDKVMRGQWSNPSAATIKGKTQVIYGGGDGYLYGLDARTGDLIWKFDCNPKKATPYRSGGGGQKGFIVATPVVHDNKVYVGIGQEPDDNDGVGHLWCIDITKEPKNKDKDLSPVGDNFDPKAAANKDSGLVWHLGGYVSPKPKDGDREFVFGRTLSTVAIHDGLVYAAEMAGFLSCIDAQTGKRYWVHDFQDNTWCSPYYVDGKVFIGTDSGDLYIFKAGKKLEPPKKVTFDQAIKMPPVAAGGVLYVNASTNLYAIKK